MYKYVFEGITENKEKVIIVTPECPSLHAAFMHLLGKYGSITINPESGKMLICEWIKRVHYEPSLFFL